MKQLIVIADPPGGKNPALKRALEIREATRAKITLLGFCYANVGKSADLANAKLSRKNLEHKLLSKRERELREVLRDFKVTSRQVAIKVMWSKEIAPAVIAWCRRHKEAVLLKSASRTNTWLHTSTDWQLIRECPVPFMLTAGKTWRKKPHILAAVDFATEVKSKQRLNNKIATQAKQLAASLQEELHLAYALEVPEILADLDLINPRKYAAEKRRLLQPRIMQFCAKHGLDPANVHIKQGPAEKVIPSIANKLKADLVVAGTVGRKGLKSKLIGNTVEGILANLYTDILTLRP